jgi:hypothetical protein
VERSADRKQLDLRTARDQPLAGINDVARVSGVASDDRDPNLSPSMQFQAADLSSGDVQTPQGRHNRTYVRALRFEITRIGRQ